MRLLLVEDNPQLAELVQEGLTRQGFAIDRCGSLKEAMAARGAASYDLILLDLGLPDGDGMSLVRELHQGNDSTPILILTARGGLNDRLIGLDGGADDYLVKPFEIAELAARCRALLRRPGASLGIVLHLGNVALDTTTRTVTVNEQRIDVPPGKSPCSNSCSDVASKSFAAISSKSRCTRSVRKSHRMHSRAPCRDSANA